LQQCKRAEKRGCSVCCRQACAGQSGKNDIKARTAAIADLERENKFEEAITLCRELIADTGNSYEQKISLYKRIVSIYQHKIRDTEKALAVYDEMLALPISNKQKAEFKLNKAVLLAGAKKLKEADLIERSVLEDQELDSGVRTSAFVSISKRIIDGKDDKKQVKELAKQLLSLKELPGNDLVRIQTQIIKASLKGNDFESCSMAVAAILAQPAANNAQKIDAVWSLAEMQALDGKIAEAEKTVRIPLSYKDMNLADTTSAYANIGKLLSWQGKCDEAVELYKEILKKDNSAGALVNVNRLVASEYVTFKRFEDAAKVYRDAAQPIDEANVYRQAQLMDKAKAVALKVLQDEKQPENSRKAAFEYFIDASPESKKVRDQYLKFYTKDFDPASNLCSFSTPIKNALYLGNYPLAQELLETARKSDALKNDFMMVYYHIRALAATGRHNDALKLAEEYQDYLNFTPGQRYRFALAAVLFRTPEKQEPLAAAIDAVNKKFEKESSVNAKLRSEELARLGSTALLAKKFDSAAALEKIYDSLFVAEEKKLLTLDFMNKPVSGISDWMALKKKPMPQLMDRKFGGNMDFLVTDVSTGNRGGGIGADTEKKMKFTEFSALCDVNGIHLLFRGFDDKVREVEAKLLGAGSYEMYLAPGINQPYTCFLPDLQSGENAVWNTTYPNENHRRFDKNSQEMRTEHIFTDDGYITYMFLSWELYYDKLPDTADRWEFENVHWGRSGGYSWNGTKSIHGRSTWGNLAFNISKEQMIGIKRKIVYSALKKYTAEKKTGHAHQGVIDFWKDPVLGDTAFYNAVIAPYVEKLDSYVALVKPDMSDADVEKVFSEAVPGWNEMGFKVAELRRNYLEKSLSKE